MRNLAEFPITIEEVISELEVVRAEALAEDQVGDMRPCLMDEAIKIVEDMPKVLAAVEDALKNIRELSRMLAELQKLATDPIVSNTPH
jgi:predicted GNAT superfamily acetyltransferase